MATDFCIVCGVTLDLHPNRQIDACSCGEAIRKANHLTSLGVGGVDRVAESSDG